MAEESLLTDEFVRQLTAAGEVDVLIGIITLNNRKTIERVVDAAQVGLVKYFPRERTVVIVADGGSVVDAAGSGAVARLSNEELPELECDVLVPAALGHVIHAQHARNVRARLGMEAANYP